MRLVTVFEGVPELRWTWLPYWMAQSPKLKQDVERVIQDAVLLNSVRLDEDGLDRLSRFVLKQLCVRFPIPGLRSYLMALDALPENP